MRNAVISVIVPIYKVEAYLEKCVNSIINQTYKNLEIILVDDGSPDSCGKMCDEFAKKDSRIKVVHKENGGLSDARNVGIAQATGEYVATIDSDDYIAEDFIESLYYMIEKSGADMSVCSFCVVSETDTPEYSDKLDFVTLHSNDAMLQMIYYRKFSVNAWNKLYKKSLFDDIKYPKGLLYEDLATTYKLIAKCDKVAVTQAKKYAYVQRKSSIMGQTGYFVSKDKVKIVDEMTEYFKKNGEKNSQIYAGILNYLMNDIYKMSSTKRLVDNKEYLDLCKPYIDKNKQIIFNNKDNSFKTKVVVAMCRYCTKLLQFLYSFGRAN